MGHRLQERPGLDLSVCGKRLEQVLGQQRHFGVEAFGDAPARAEGVRARAVAARRLPGRQRRHFRPRLSASAERRPQAGAIERSAPPPPRLYQWALTAAPSGPMGHRLSRHRRAIGLGAGLSGSAGGGHQVSRA